MTGRSDADGSNVFVRHFWKIFAISLAAAVLYFTNAAISKLSFSKYRPFAVALEMQNESWLPDSLSGIIEHQMGPATVILKDATQPVTGYVARTDGGCLVLSNATSEQSKEEAVFVPWENVLYVKVLLKEK